MSNDHRRDSIRNAFYDYAAPAIFAIALILAVFGLILLIQGALTAGTVLLVWGVIVTFAGVAFLVAAR